MIKHKKKLKNLKNSGHDDMPINELPMKGTSSETETDKYKHTIERDGS